VTKLLQPRRFLPIGVSVLRSDLEGLIGISMSSLTRRNSKVSDAVVDIVGALRNFPNIVYLAMVTVRLRYRRSILGPLWISLTTAIFIFFIGYLYSGFIQMPFAEYLLNLALGWVIWHFIADSILQGGQTFQQASRIIQTTNIEKFSLVLRTVLTNLIVFGISLSIPLLTFIAIGTHFTLATLLIIPALGLIVLSALAASAFFGIACARYRDLYPLLQSIVRVLFFVTPVLWTPALLATESPRRLIVDLNPLAHYVAIWRQPLLGENPDALSWVVTSGCTIAGLCVAFTVFAAHRQKLIFWI